MADTLSRRHDLTDHELLTLFDSEYPQTKPWHMSQLSNEMLLALNSSLRRKRPDVASCLLHSPTEPLSSTTGWLTATALVMTLSSLMSPLLSSSTSSLSSASNTDEASFPVVWSPSDLSMWRRPYVLLARSSPNWGRQIRKWMEPITNTDSVLSLRPGMMRIQPPHEFGPSTSLSSAPWPDDSNTIPNPTEPMPSSICVSLGSSSYADQVSMLSPLPLNGDAAPPSDYATSPSAVPPYNALVLPSVP